MNIKLENKDYINMIYKDDIGMIYKEILCIC